VGTETRGSRTQRFGFVPPYEGFVNYRWIGSLTGARLGGAWFDHGDCEANDFVDQAWQTVLAGAREIVLFNSDNLVAGHPGHDLLRRDFDKLALVPQASFPQDAETIFLPTQAAADPNLETQTAQAIAAGRSLVVTAGLLAVLPADSAFHQWAGLVGPPRLEPKLAPQLLESGQTVTIDPPLRLAGPLVPATAQVTLEAVVDDAQIPFLTEHRVGQSRVSVLNIHTFSQADFDAVGEVLLAPRPLGLLEMPRSWAARLREAFGAGQNVRLHAPTRVTLQPLRDRGWFVQNYNDQPVRVELELTADTRGPWVDGFTGEPLVPNDNVIARTLPARSRWWVDASRDPGESNSRNRTP
jgi:hypothetical protein